MLYICIYDYNIFAEIYMYIIYAKYTYSVRVLYKLGAHYCGSFYGEQTHQLAWKNLGTRQRIHISVSFELF